MATVTTKQCDVFKEIGEDVHTYTLKLCREDVRADDGAAIIINKSPDLCLKALKRLLKCIATGTTPPGGKGK